MNSVEQLEVLIGLAQEHGYRVRYDYFGGTGGGFCQFNGAKWLFIDLALSPHEQVEHLEQEMSTHAASSLMISRFTTQSTTESSRQS